MQPDPSLPPAEPVLEFVEPPTSQETAPPLPCHVYGPGLNLTDGKPTGLKMVMVRFQTAQSSAVTLEAAIGSREELDGLVKDLGELADKLWPQSPLHLPKGFRR